MAVFTVVVPASLASCPQNQRNRTKGTPRSVSMLLHQRGATAIGMLIVVAIVGLGLYACIRLLPIYTEYMAVGRALEQTATETSGDATSPAELRRALDRRWTVEDIKSIQPKDIEIKKISGGFSMRAYYRAEAPFVSNISLVADFDKTVDVR
jgi:hypothetical protein